MGKDRGAERLKVFEKRRKFHGSGVSISVVMYGCAKGTCLEGAEVAVTDCRFNNGSDCQLGQEYSERWSVLRPRFGDRDERRSWSGGRV